MSDSDSTPYATRRRLVYATNIWNHYQRSIGEQLFDILGPDGFRMVLFEKLHGERRDMGWTDEAPVPWVSGPPSSAAERDGIVRTCLEADAMVVGDCPQDVLRSRVSTGKLTFVAAERLLKWRMHRLRTLNPRYSLGFARYRRIVNHPNVHALAIGHHAPSDLRTIGAFGDRIWRWGYFPDVGMRPPPERPPRPIRVFWAGRCLDWKRVDVLLRAVAMIQDEPSFGDCTIVGDGPQRDRWIELAGRLRLAPERVRFLPSVPVEAVRQHMRESDVYVLPSDRGEGWGVVANEAMSEGCVLVANEDAGAARELIDHGVSGFVFRDGDASGLADILRVVATDAALRARVARRGWESLASLWTPRLAAERLVALVDGLSGGTSPGYETGPCSRA